MWYTGQGDTGYTQVIGGPRLPKSDLRLEALGALDEAQAHLGVARALLAATPWAAPLARVQGDLRLVMAECATVVPGAPCHLYLSPEHLHRVEDDLAAWETLTGGFRGFTLPGESVPGAHLHLARTVIRRAERHLVALAERGDAVAPLVQRYLNRLSSWAYALTLVLDATAPGDQLSPNLS